MDASGNVLERNSFRNESVSNVDLRIAKQFDFGSRYGVEIFAQVFNLFDETAFELGNGFSNDRNRDPNRPDDFGLASTRVLGPKQWELGARFKF